MPRKKLVKKNYKKIITSSFVNIIQVFWYNPWIEPPDVMFAHDHCLGKL